MKTEFFVKYDLYDLTALEDARESTTTNASFANIGLIKDDVQAPKYGTLEHNFFVLDGTCEEFPDNPGNLVYFSSTQSGADGTFATEQKLVASFTENHTSIGITLHFLDAYPLELEIFWYDLKGIIKTRKTFYPDALIYFCRKQVENYGRVEIVFKKTLPYHNVKLQHIKYGTTFVWGVDTINSGKLVNDTDQTSDKIKTDKLTFSFVDVEDEFNFGNEQGMHRTFQRNQHMEAYEMVNGKKIILGTFFLDSVSTNKNVSKMTAVDYKGKLSNNDFMGGRMYNGTLAGTIIDEIMATAGIEDYVVDAEIASIPLYGTLKIQTCQKALREVLFATGSIINTSHRTNLEIRKYDRLVKHKVGVERKFSTSYKIDKYISDISVKYKTWVLDDKVSQITKGKYGVGTHTVKLSNPATNMTSNAGTILSQTPYYVVLKVKEEQEIIISGNKYIGTELAASATIEQVKGGEARSAKSFTGTLLNFELAQEVAERLLEHYQLQQIIKAKYIANNEKSGDWAEIENPVMEYSNFVMAIESMSTDLTDGFITNATCRGYFKETMNFYFAGNELYAYDGLVGGLI